MGEGSDISAIVPLYNREKYVGETIRSALNQTLPARKNFVVDDGSTNGSADVVKQFSPPLIYHYQENGGCGAARNTGVRLSLSSVLAFLDSDDLWSEDKLEKQWGALQADPQLDMVFGWAQNFHSPELTTEQRKRLAAPMQPMTGKLASAMLIRRDAMMRVGETREDLSAAEVIDWYGRAKDAGLKELLLPGVVLKRRLHGDTQLSKSSDRSDYLRAIRAMLARRNGT